MDEYIDVAERIQDFKDTHPNGSLQTLGWEVVSVEGYNEKTGKDVKQTFIVYRAAAFRDENDVAPGHGIAWEPFPGLTPYTAKSELMNAETAAWGRAIVALGLVANRSLASRQEVRNRQAEQAGESVSEAPQEAAHEPTGPAEADTVKADAKADAAPTLDPATLKRLRVEMKKVGATADRVKFALVEIGVDVDPNNADAVKLAISALTLDDLGKLCDTLAISFEAVTGTESA